MAANPSGDLPEGTQIAPGACSTGTIAVYSAPSQPNRAPVYLSAAWVITTDGVDPVTLGATGRMNIVAEVTVLAVQVGPRFPNGTARYQWLGCFQGECE